MFRTFAALAVLIILPGLAWSQSIGQTQQQAQATHEVVKGETLWALAERYLGDPYRWPLIYEANQGAITDPDLIFPGQTLAIPRLAGQEVSAEAPPAQATPEEPAEVRGVDVTGPPRQAPPQEDLPPCPGPEGRTVFYQGEGPRGCEMPEVTASQRTTFYQDPRRLLAGEIMAEEAREQFAVPRPLVYQAPWVLPMEEEIQVVGKLEELSAGIERRAFRDRALPYELLNATVAEGVSLQVGDVLQSFVVAREEEGLGRVLHPTGIVTVTSVEEAGVVVAVSAEFERVKVTDFLRRAPEYTLRRGVSAREVSSNVTGTILGFAGRGTMPTFGSVAFLDVGRNQGVAVGDEFSVVVNAGEGWSGQKAARLQVISAGEERASARVVTLNYPVLEPGLQGRLVKKMQ